MKMEISVEWNIFALGYLGVWFSEDKWWTEQLADKEKKLSLQERCSALSNFARYYGVSRNLKTLDDETPGHDKFRLQTALELLDAVTELGDVASTVAKYSTSLADSYWHDSSRICVSAASKFLWLKFQSPVIIFDSQALASLYAYDKKLREVRDDVTYRAYCEAWRKLYQLFCDDVHQACAGLFEPGSRLKGDDHQLQDFVCQDWFKERVFDMWLWSSETPALIQNLSLRG